MECIKLTAVIAGALFLLSSWYTRGEVSIRSVFLFSDSQLGSAFSRLIGAGIHSGLDGARGLDSWRWPFIVEGSIIIFVALLAMNVLPGSPYFTCWLN
jgi:peroxiredoxin